MMTTAETSSKTYLRQKRGHARYKLHSLFGCVCSLRPGEAGRASDRPPDERNDYLDNVQEVDRQLQVCTCVCVLFFRIVPHVKSPVQSILGTLDAAERTKLCAGAWSLFSLRPRCIYRAASSTRRPQNKRKLCAAACSFSCHLRLCRSSSKHVLLQSRASVSFSSGLILFFLVVRFECGYVRVSKRMLQARVWFSYSSPVGVIHIHSSRWFAARSDQK